MLIVLEVRDEVIAAAAQQCTGFLAINVAPPRPLPAGVLERADLIVANRHEFAAVPGVSSGRLVAVTMGSEGARLIRDGVEVAYCRPPAVPVVDGTAAGDAFTAALLVGLLEQMSDTDALRFAVTAGASRSAATARSPRYRGAARSRRSSRRSEVGVTIHASARGARRRGCAGGPRPGGRLEGCGVVDQLTPAVHPVTPLPPLLQPVDERLLPVSGGVVRKPGGSRPGQGLQLSDGRCTDRDPEALAFDLDDEFDSHVVTSSVRGAPRN